MSGNDDGSAAAALERIVESAERLGVEVDEEEALQWLAAIAASQDNEVVMDVRSGTFGHRVTMLDFSPAELARFREIGNLVGFEDRPGVLESALALSGSAAQSKIQSYPGDSDFFERVNVHAPTREVACRLFATAMREKALATREGPGYRLIEVKFGGYPQDLIRDGTSHRAGTPIAWHPDEIEAGRFQATDLEGKPLTVSWESVQDDPGWCKLDWLVVDPIHQNLSNASNMLDVTWEAPDGSITPLDGYLDPYFQEVYLEADSIPLFSRVARHVSSDALASYVEQLEHEVEKYLTRDTNYGKAAKRMYNIFRLTGRYGEAAFLRELFDEPATILYQIYSLIRTLDDAVGPGRNIPIEQISNQADQLVLAAVEALEGEEELEVVRKLLTLKSALTFQKSGEELAEPVQAARAQVINLINNFFHERLVAVPEIKDYMDGFPRQPEPKPV